MLIFNHLLNFNFCINILSFLLNFIDKKLIRKIRKMTTQRKQLSKTVLQKRTQSLLQRKSNKNLMSAARKKEFRRFNKKEKIGIDLSLSLKKNDEKEKSDFENDFHCKENFELKTDLEETLKNFVCGNRCGDLCCGDYKVWLFIFFL